MKEVFIKDKKATHTLKVDGKEIIFINGKATIMDEDAKKIKAGKEYVIRDVIPPKDDFKPAREEKKHVGRPKKEKAEKV
jgi:hypothetical protein